MKRFIVAALFLSACACPKPPHCPPDPVPCPLSPVCVQDAPGQPPQPAGFPCNNGGTCDGAGHCCPAK